MVQLVAKAKDAPVEKGKKLYTIEFGNASVVDIRAKSKKEAEELFMFLLIYNLRGKTIDYDPSTFKD